MSEIAHDRKEAAETVRPRQPREKRSRPMLRARRAAGTAAKKRRSSTVGLALEAIRECFAAAPLVLLAEEARGESVMVDRTVGAVWAGTRRIGTIGAAWGAAALLLGAGANVGSAGLPTLTSPASAQTVAPLSRPDGFADIIDKVKPAVFAVHTKIEQGSAGQGLASPQGSPFERFSRQFGRSLAPNDEAHTPSRTVTTEGSGFFISADGYAVTTNHVIEGGKSVEITTDDHQTYGARIVGTDAKTDLALLKVDAGRKVPFVRLANTTPRIGEWVLAVGNPFGLGGTVTAGIVSARGRDIETGAHRNLIQIDAPVNRGNSGGPTFNLDGDVIGVNSVIFSPTGGSVGIGFAIPAETVNAVIPQLRGKEP